MRIFLDSAHVQSIQECVLSGLVDGITTNPTSFAKESDAPLATIAAIQKILPQGIINVEITENSAELAYQQAVKIRNIGHNIVVKIPCYLPFFPLIKRLVQEKIPVNITLVFSVAQAVLMGKMGVAFISPFVGRLYDNGVDGIATLSAMIAAYKQYQFSTAILAASLRTTEQIDQALALGVDIITVSPTLFKAMAAHSLTEQGIAQFNTDWHAKKIDFV